MDTPKTLSLDLLQQLFTPICNDTRCALCVIELLRDDSGNPLGFVGRVASQLFCELLSLHEADILGKKLPESVSQDLLALPALMDEFTRSGAKKIRKDLPLGDRSCSLQALFPCPELLTITIQDTQPDQAMISSQAEMILASLGDPCTIIDRNFSILYENETAKELWGSNLGRTCYTLYHGRQSRCEFCHAAGVFADGKIHKNEKVMRINGSERHLEITSAPLKDDTGTVTAVVNITRDVTIRKMTEKSKEHLISELQASLAKTKRLNGLLPICSCCKKIKDGNGVWQQLESYLRSRAEVEFSHGICEECDKKHQRQAVPKKK